jgi:hypothetical protein
MSGKPWMDLLKLHQQLARGRARPFEKLFERVPHLFGDLGRTAASVSFPDRIQAVTFPVPFPHVDRVSVDLQLFRHFGGEGPPMQQEKGLSPPSDFPVGILFRDLFQLPFFVRGQANRSGHESSLGKECSCPF